MIMSLLRLKKLKRKNKGYNSIMNKKKISRLKRALRTRIKLKKLMKLRLVIHRTSRHIYAQIIDPKSYNVLTSASTVEKNIINNLSYSGNKNAAKFIGQKIGERALKLNILQVSFDRSGFKYHGRIKELANAARASGLEF